MSKSIKIFLYTDDVAIVDVVFGYALKMNIIEGARFEIIRKRQYDNLNSISAYDLIIIDEMVSDPELSSAFCSSVKPVIRVIRNSMDSTRVNHPKVIDMVIEKLKIYLSSHLQLRTS